MNDTTNEATEPMQESPSHSLDHAIPAERIRKSKRTRWLLVTVITLLVLGMVALGYMLVTFVMEGNAASSQADVAVTPDTALENGLEDTTVTPVEVHTTTVPALVPLFGLTIEECLDELGDEFTVTKTEATAADDTAVVRQLVTITYTPETQATTTGSAMQTRETIYASMDANGRIIEIYYVAAMPLLGVPEVGFDELVATSETCDDILGAAKVVPTGFTYVAPGADAYSKYDEATGKLLQETTTFSGACGQPGVAPNNWALTLTYGYGSGRAAGDDTPASERMIYLKLT